MAPGPDARRDRSSGAARALRARGPAGVLDAAARRGPSMRHGDEPAELWAGDKRGRASAG